MICYISYYYAVIHLYIARIWALSCKKFLFTFHATIIIGNQNILQDPPNFNTYFYLQMRTTNGANFYKILYLFYSGFSHMILRKRKLNLLTGFIICSNSCNCSASHNFIYLYILDRVGKDRTQFFVLQQKLGLQ